VHKKAYNSVREGHMGTVVDKVIMGQVEPISSVFPQSVPCMDQSTVPPAYTILIRSSTTKAIQYNIIKWERRCITHFNERLQVKKVNTNFLAINFIRVSIFQMNVWKFRSLLTYVTPRSWQWFQIVYHTNDLRIRAHMMLGNLFICMVQFYLYLMPFP
jgi:hypothetical protein